MADLMIDQKSVVIGQHDVILKTINGERFMVVYGAQVNWYHTAAGALKEYESCVRHQWTCAGFLDADEE